jgi:hypothetical protein
MTTKLVWRPPHPTEILAGKSVQLGVVDVSPFSAIRVIAFAKDTAPVVTLELIATAGMGGDRFTYLDRLQLPTGGITRVYQVPGLALTIDAVAAAGTGSTWIDVLIFGF